MELAVHQESKDEIGGPPFSPPPMKKSETRDSISSVDSDVSLSFDRRGSKGEEADLSDYDSSEIRSAKISADPDSGADSVEGDTASKGLTKQEQNVPDASTVGKVIDDFVLDDESADKICAQVEFYFSDENIVKDAFLLKHVKRNKEGYVSLKLISSFKRVKHLNRDWRVVGAALARSKKLEVNPQGTKLRRIDPLPLYDQTTPSRTILAAGLPIEKLTVESVAEFFKPCGEIALIRVLRPGHPIPSEVRQAISKRPELASSEECAMIEFTDSTSARIATQMALDDAKIFELHQSADKRKKHQPVKKSALNRVTRVDNHYNSSSCPSGSEPEDGRARHKRSFPGYPMYHLHTGYPLQVGPLSPDAWLSRKLSSCSVSSSENGFMFRRLSSCSGSSSDTSRRYSTCSSGSETTFCHPVYPNNFYHHENRRYSCCSSTGSPMDCGGSYYVTDRRGSADYGPFLRKLSTCSRDSGYDMRRLSLCSSNSEQSGFCLRSKSNSDIAVAHLPENITRMPSGPDGTRGFFGRSARMPISAEPTC